MKRGEIVALSRAAAKRVKTNKVGVVATTKFQHEKLAEHKRKKAKEKDKDGGGFRLVAG